MTKSMTGRRSNYTLEEIELCLQTLVRCSNNSGIASRTLAKKHGIKISGAQLRKWRTDSHKERYLELVETLVPVVRAQAAQQAAALAEREGHLSDHVLSELFKRLPEMENKDVVQLQKANATSRNVNLTHLDKMQTDPDAKGTERLTAEEVMRELKRKAPGLFVEGTATEEPVDAELVADNDVSTF